LREILTIDCRTPRSRTTQVLCMFEDVSTSLISIEYELVHQWRERTYSCIRAWTYMYLVQLYVMQSMNCAAMRERLMRVVQLSKTRASPGPSVQGARCCTSNTRTNSPNELVVIQLGYQLSMQIWRLYERRKRLDLLSNKTPQVLVQQLVQRDTRTQKWSGTCQ
jgi:hypothetical protein